VRDKAVQEEALRNVTEWIGSQPDWRCLSTVESPILGGDGNREFLLLAKKRGG